MNQSLNQITRNVGLQFSYDHQESYFLDQSNDFQNNHLFDDLDQDESEAHDIQVNKSLYLHDDSFQNSYCHSQGQCQDLCLNDLNQSLFLSVFDDIGSSTLLVSQTKNVKIQPKKQNKFTQYLTKILNHKQNELQLSLSLDLGVNQQLSISLNNPKDISHITNKDLILKKLEKLIDVDKYKNKKSKIQQVKIKDLKIQQLKRQIKDKTPQKGQKKEVNKKQQKNKLIQRSNIQKRNQPLKKRLNKVSINSFDFQISKQDKQNNCNLLQLSKINQFFGHKNTKKLFNRTDKQNNYQQIDIQVQLLKNNQTQPLKDITIRNENIFTKYNYEYLQLRLKQLKEFTQSVNNLVNNKNHMKLTNQLQVFEMLFNYNQNCNQSSTELNKQLKQLTQEKTKLQEKINYYEKQNNNQFNRNKLMWDKINSRRKQILLTNTQKLIQEQQFLFRQLSQLLC